MITRHLYQLTIRVIFVVMTLKHFDMMNDHALSIEQVPWFIS